MRIFTLNCKFMLIFLEICVLCTLKELRLCNGIFNLQEESVDSQYSGGGGSSCSSNSLLKHDTTQFYKKDYWKNIRHRFRNSFIVRSRTISSTTFSLRKSLFYDKVNFTVIVGKPLVQAWKFVLPIV